MIKFSDDELQKLVDMFQKKAALAAIMSNYDKLKDALPTFLPQLAKKITDQPVAKYIAEQKPMTAQEIKNLKTEYFKALRDERLGLGEKKAASSQKEGTVEQSTDNADGRSE